MRKEAICQVPECEGTVVARGYCNAHYGQMRNRGWVGPVRRRILGAMCEFEGCERKHKAQGYCSYHYRQHQSGKPLTPIMYASRPSSDTTGHCQVPGCRMANRERYGAKCLGHFLGELTAGMQDRGALCRYPDCPNESRVSPGICESHHWMVKNSGVLVPLRGSRYEGSPDHCPIPQCARRRATFGSLCGRHGALGRNYGLSQEETIDLYGDGTCNVCGDLAPLHIDHDHSCCPKTPACGKCVRGALCRGCNHAIGLAKDSPERLLGMAQYVKKHRERLAPAP